MHLVSQVIFNYAIDRKIGTHSGELSTIAELKDVISKTFHDQMMRVAVERVVQIIDTDDVVYPEGVSRFHTLKNKQSQQYKTVVVGQEQFKFYVVDKIMYPRDVRKILNEKYGGTLDFDAKKLNEEQPICDFHVSERTQYGLRTSNPTANHLSDSFIGNPTMYTLRSVYCCTADEGTIFVDRDLNQIWPQATKQPPKPLIELLSKTKEEIR